MIRAVTSPAGKSAEWALSPRPARWQQRSRLAGSRRTCPLLLLAWPGRPVPELLVSHQGADVHGFPKPPQLDATCGPRAWSRRERAGHPRSDQSHISGNTGTRRMHPPIRITSLSKTFCYPPGPGLPDQADQPDVTIVIEAKSRERSDPHRHPAHGRPCRRGCEQAGPGRPGVWGSDPRADPQPCPCGAAALRSCLSARCGWPGDPWP